MNREIKFRAWDKSKKRFFQSKDEDISWNIPTIAGINNMIPKYAIITFFDTAQNFIYSQYTGLKDKNHIEIYEGDIVKFDDPDYGMNICEVRYENAQFLNCRDYNDDHDGVVYPEVIGNIHENKELLDVRRE